MAKRKKKEETHIPVGSVEAALKVARDMLRYRYENIWKPSWREAMPFEQLVAAFTPDNPEKLAQASEKQIQNSVGMLCVTRIELGFAFAPIIACRTGRHPSCIDGQPYDPRYQQPNTLPLAH